MFLCSALPGSVVGRVCWETLEEVPWGEMKVNAIANIHPRQLFMNIKEHLRAAAMLGLKKKGGGKNIWIQSQRSAFFSLTEGLSVNKKLGIE